MIKTIIKKQKKGFVKMKKRWTVLIKACLKNISFAIYFFVWNFSIAAPTPHSTYLKFSERPPVKQFIRTMVQQHQFNQQKLVTLFNQVRSMPTILKKVKHPAEEQPWFQYRKIFFTPQRIQEGVKFWQKNQQTLKRAEKIYGVPAKVIVAIIAVESNYGQKLGEFRVLDALSNLAFSPSSRHTFFKNQLSEFLLLCREKSLSPLQVMGSYAGAIGQPQFMPQSFRDYAIDFNHSGHIDLTHDTADVIGSIANYLNKKGWHKNQIALFPTKKRTSTPLPFRLNVLKPLYFSSRLRQFFLLPSHVIRPTKKYGIIQLKKQKGFEYWIGAPNFYVILAYNEHIKYGITTLLLSEKIERAYFKTKKHKSLQRA
jgi:membrane-bound lytic murein transglycosylase B